MRIVIAYNFGSLRRWHIWLAEALSKHHHVTLSGHEGARPVPGSLSVLQSLERIVYRRGSEHASDACTVKEFQGPAISGPIDGADFDLAIDLTAGMVAAPDQLRTIAPLYDGIADELAAADALLNRKLVEIAIYDRALGTCISRGVSATEDRNVFSQGLDNVFCRAAALLASAVGSTQHVSLGVEPAVPGKALAASAAVASFLVASVTAKATALLTKLSGGGHQWSVAWRRTNGDAICEQPTPRHVTFQRYPNSPESYLADPFLVARDGRHYLFVEEFKYAENRGVISVVTIEKDGSTGRPHVVLDLPYHLSYPFVFERDGETFMIPESGASRRVELYRAERFPDRWVLDTVLLDDIAAYDVTLTERDGRLWLFMATAKWQSSSWDTLEIYQADNLRGPWTPMSGNPVLVNPSGARPAGAMFERSGALWRPAQDCSLIYGGKLALCRVDQLTADQYRQTTAAYLAPSPQSNVSGVHTLNYAAGIETVDIFAAASTEPVKLIIETVSG